MRLKKLQISGFKSFVDKTDIFFLSQLSGVVGPNGCGKSNVIDAVRWVMGEVSAKNLRGDNMADIIFNGSTARKPVGKASVELIFDNSQRKLQGSYAKFSEISVKRTLTRDGQSIYLINNVKARRKDVLDLFRGTGLGSRSYSIIEQGMVSQIIEARPEDLRNYVEEAAGVSKYKNKRRETENRIAHARENLERVLDIRNELEKQLHRLKRQSSSAQRYKALKEEQYAVQGGLLYLRSHRLEQQLVEQERVTAKAENTLQMALADQRGIETLLEDMRQRQSHALEESSSAQQALYKIEVEISGIEEKIKYQNSVEKQRKDELSSLLTTQSELKGLVVKETDSEQVLQTQIRNVLPELNVLQEKNAVAIKDLESAELIRDDWQIEMEHFIRDAQQPAQQIEVQKSRISYLEKQVKRVNDTKQSLLNQKDQLTQYISQSTITEFRQKVEQKTQYYQSLEEKVLHEATRLQSVNSQLNAAREKLDHIKQDFHEKSSRLKSLQEIQLAALNEEDEGLHQWLEESHSGRFSRVAKHIEVKEGWERAVDVVLGDVLGAICLDQLNLSDLRTKPASKFTVFTKQALNDKQSGSFASLLSKVKTSEINLSSKLSNVYVAEDLEAAFELRNQIHRNEYIVTKQGELVGPNWFRFPSQNQLETGILVREEEIHQLQDGLQKIQSKLDEGQRKIHVLEQQRMEAESLLTKKRSMVAQIQSETADLHTRFAREETQILEAQDQLKKIETPLQALIKDIDRDIGELKNAKMLLQAASAETDDLDKKRHSLLRRRDELNQMVQENRDKVDTSKEQLHQNQLKKQQLESQAEAAQENIKRLHIESKNTANRLLDLRNDQSAPVNTVVTLEQELSDLLERKTEIDRKYLASTDAVVYAENQLNEISNSRKQAEENVEKSRAWLEQQKLGAQEIKTRKEALSETVKEKNYAIEQYAANLSEDTSIEEWQKRLDAIERKINNIGPVNLVAIEEFEEQSQRMKYIDTQYNDLIEALDILESVIRKIDKETRSRFRETFDAINENFKVLFPKLFGGGIAQLIMSSNDLLTTGISVTAQPPGKRNSHIHLLSGGEKALTAVALLFSLFKLTPAPFCMMDEVDAPLDDANVMRYCETLKALSEVSQIVVITHNKITMETMDNLVGVTMAEAGVSRLVSVDIAEAVKFSA